jgi:hypothetical protein
MQGEQPIGPAAAPACRGFDELFDRGLEVEGEFFDALAKRIPGVEPVLSGDHRLCIVERDGGAPKVGVRAAGEGREGSEAPERGEVARAGGVEQVFCLPLELFKVRSFG